MKNIFKHAQPLQKYIDAKDSFDFKNNNYTTTENVDTTPNEDVRKMQRKLNEAGRKYGVNPAIIASCIYTEQIRNVNFIDTLNIC